MTQEQQPNVPVDAAAIASLMLAVEMLTIAVGK
jgi:hypothetical protein